MLEFRVNKYLTLELRENSTIILVDGKEFIQCKFLLVRNIRLDEIEDTIYKFSLSSIDELGFESNINYFDLKNFKICPQEEFWAHCSNIQVWTENDYNSDLLHSNLAFPLLKKLAEVGDSIAVAVFKEEIAKRFETGHIPIIYYLFIEGYLDYLPDSYFKSLYKNNNSFYIDLIFESINSESFAEAYIFSLYLFDRFYLYLSKKMKSQFINKLKRNPKNIEKILYNPKMLISWKNEYINFKRLDCIRKELINSIIEKNEFKSFHLTKTESYDFLRNLKNKRY